MSLIFLIISINSICLKIATQKEEEKTPDLWQNILFIPTQ